MRKTISTEYADAIIKHYEGAETEQSFLFVTTWRRYQYQLQIIEDLKAEIDTLDSSTVTKEYVKDRKNTVINPSITEFNRTSTAANNTAATLLKILRDMRDTELGKGATDDEFLAFIQDKDEG